MTKILYVFTTEKSAVAASDKARALALKFELDLKALEVELACKVKEYVLCLQSSKVTIIFEQESDRHTVAQANHAGVRGPWQVGEWPEKQVVVQSHHGDRDLALALSGNFPSYTEKLQAAEHIAKLLEHGES